MRVTTCVLILGTSLMAIAAPPKSKPPAHKTTPRQQFVLDTVRAAVAVPQPDPQDRLRVLAAAAQVVTPVSRRLERAYAREGARLEAELIAQGAQPAVSVIASGHVDCASAAQFVDSLPATAVPRAEASLIAVATSCPKALDSVRRKVEAGLAANSPAPLATLATAERTGIRSRWSQVQLAELFSALPSRGGSAPAYAQAYARMASHGNPDAVRDSGLRLLDWLATHPASSERNLAVNTVTDALKSAVGDAAYDEVLRADATAQSIARTAGQAGQVEMAPEENVSVLEAMTGSGKQTDAIAAMKPSLRARHAAANGFAAGTRGDANEADQFFDISFSAADQVWAERDGRADAPAVVQEVSEAAAQVDAIAALRRARTLSDPTAQAIAMLSVARVVLGQEDTPAGQVQQQQVQQQK